MKRILICFLILTSFSACTKFGKTYRVKGRVLNPVTGQGIEGAEVRIYKNTMELPGGSKMQKSAITDSEGNFDMSKLAFRTDNISVYSFPGEYYPIGWTQNSGQSFDMPALKMGKTMHADYYAVPYGSMKYTIKNTSCFDQNDILVINRKYQLTNLTNSYTGSSTYNGCFEFIGNVYSQYPMGWHYMSGYYTKNNITTNFSDSIYIDSGGYHEWIFEY